MHAKDWKPKQTRIILVTAGGKRICLFLQQGQQLQRDRSYGMLDVPLASQHSCRDVLLGGDAALCVAIKIVCLVFNLHNVI